ncbi:MAG: hypothetical protein AAF383_22195 [Cyanobacteria bacterium P01_A01_bin.83]
MNKDTVKTCTTINRIVAAMTPENVITVITLNPIIFSTTTNGVITIIALNKGLDVIGVDGIN